MPPDAPEPRILTIGYQRLAPARLDAILDDLGALLVDVRAKPWSRIPGWSGAALAARYGARYRPMGDVLGGGPHVTRATRPAKLWPAGLRALRALPGPLLLLCLEPEPWRCHRHWVALGLKEPVSHLYGDQIIDAAELERSIQDENEYLYAEMPALKDDERSRVLG